MLETSMTADDEASPRPCPAGPAPLAPGTTLAGRFVVEKILGAGGMGIVVAAKHQGLGISVAVKLLRGDAGEPVARARVLREAAALAKVSDPHVARVYDAGCLENGTPYVAMEMLAGEDLAQYLARRGRLPIDVVVDFAKQICAGLAAVHREGLVHRDLKPSNVFVADAWGKPVLKILDFGIAKMHGSDQSLTRTGQALGSVHYMAPEQLECARRVDGRADIWSLGVVLFELLTASRPFPKPVSAELVHRILHESAPRASEFRADVPPALDRLVAHCLERSPARRPRSIGDVMNALVEVEKRRAGIPPRLGLVHGLRRRSNARWPKLAVGVASAALVGLALLRPGHLSHPGNDITPALEADHVEPAEARIGARVLPWAYPPIPSAAPSQSPTPARRREAVTTKPSPPGSAERTEPSPAPVPASLTGRVEDWLDSRH